MTISLQPIPGAALPLTRLGAGPLSSRNRTCRMLNLRCCLFGAVFLLRLGCPSGLAQEQTISVKIAEPGPLLAYAAPVSRVTPAELWSAPASTAIAPRNRDRARPSPDAAASELAAATDFSQPLRLFHAAALEAGENLRSSETFAQPASAPEADGKNPGASKSLTDSFQVEGLLLQAAVERSSASQDDLALMHRKMHSHFAYDCWADLGGGFGQFSPDDRLGRSRINGAGVEVPDCLYVKMSFRF